jgi:hypothetical protein
LKRIWINYKLWEDHQAGLYAKNKQSDDIFNSVKEMFENPELFERFSNECLIAWPFSMDQNLSYFGSNRKSYLGQATACFKFGANIQTTCKAWELLSIELKNKNNLVAEKTIEKYDNEIYPTRKIDELNEELS